jgi:DUF1680 family protein
MADVAAATGDRFFYVNPLGSKGNHHRVPWFGTSCCPTNIVRYVPGMGERVYAHRDNDVWTVLYVGSTAMVALKDGKVKLTQETDYPWDGKVRIKVEPEKSFEFGINLRIPGWCREAPSIIVNGEEHKEPLEKGYVRIGRTWQAGDVLELNLPMSVQRVYADPHVKADVGRVALMRGPIVYCLEGVDNGGQVRNLCLPRDAKLSATFEKDLLRGVVVVRGEALAVTQDKEDEKRTTRPGKFLAVPYSTWDNRQPGPMVVWLPEEPGLAEVAGEDGVLSNGVRVTASHCWQNDTLTALNVGQLP